MAVDTSYVQSSLELNPRWSAPEVIQAGHYSTAADVYSFGVVLWELLTWQVRALVCVFLGGGGAVCVWGGGNMRRGGPGRFQPGKMRKGGRQ
jgi:hypothetical protein